MPNIEEVEISLVEASIPKTSDKEAALQQESHHLRSGVALVQIESRSLLISKNYIRPIPPRIFYPVRNCSSFSTKN